MSEVILQDGEVVVRALGSLRRLTLNRPQALNAITLDMAVTMTAFMREWADDPAVGAVLIDGAGERAFCAGGDIRALYDAAKSGDPLPEQFWATEYRLNVLIARYPKPVIAIMDGLVMGGGVGLSAHAAHCILTDRSAVAMPEVAIGFFPDVGVSFLLTRAPGAGHLRSAHRQSPQRFRCGPLRAWNSHILSSRLGEIPKCLADCRNRKEVWAALAAPSKRPPASGNTQAMDWIAASAATRWKTSSRRYLPAMPMVHEALVTMRKASPTSLKITLRNLREAASFKRVEECFRQDYRIALACVAGHDFIEGIRAAIVDKDRNPAWRPDKLEAVTQEIVERHFQSVGKLELNFET